MLNLFHFSDRYILFIKSTTAGDQGIVFLLFCTYFMRFFNFSYFPNSIFNFFMYLPITSSVIFFIFFLLSLQRHPKLLQAKMLNIKRENIMRRMSLTIWV